MQDYSTQITDYLKTQSWQIAVLVVVIAAITLALKNKSAHVRYLLWLIVLAKCLVPPLLTIPLAVLPDNKAVIILPPVEPTEPTVAEPVVEVSAAEVPAPPAPVIIKRTPRLTDRQWLALAWIMGVSIFVLVASAKALRTELWLRYKRKPLPTGLQTETSDLFSSLGVRISSKLWLVEGVGQPFVWGLLRGSIYLPANFMRVNNAEHRRGVLGHEISHVVRFDATVNLFQVIAHAVFWFHPFVWWTNKKIRAEREKCCDEITVARLGANAKDYSRAIVNMLISEQESTRPVPSLAVAGPVKNIEERIKTMLRPGKKFHKRPSLRAITVLLMVALLTIPANWGLTRRARAEKASEPQEKPSKLLHEAAVDGRLEELKALLEQGVDVDLKDSEGNTPLHLACKKGSRRRNVVRFLLDQGAAIDARNNDQKTPLDLVSLRPGRQEVAELLLERGAPISTMHIAAFVGRLDKVRSFIANGAEIDAKNEDGQTPLFTAVYGGHIDIATLLLDNGANVNEKDNGGGAPLFYAIWHFKNEIARLLIDRGADIHDSALRSAAMVGNEEMADLLVAKRVDVDVKDEHGMSALDLAVEPGSSAIARLLAAKGAEVSKIHTAALVGDLEKLKSFLENGTDINAEWRGVSVLHAASASGNRKLVEFLLAKGADINAKIRSGMRYDQTPLHWAASNGSTEVAEFLIGKGSDVNARDFFRRTPLHIAAGRGHEAVASLLLSKGASLNAGDRQSRTPLSFAEEQGHTEIVELLRKHGAME